MTKPIHPLRAIIEAHKEYPSKTRSLYRLHLFCQHTTYISSQPKVKRWPCWQCTEALNHAQLELFNVNHLGDSPRVRQLRTMLNAPPRFTTPTNTRGRKDTVL